MDIDNIIDQNYFLVTLSIGSTFIYLFSQRPELVKRLTYN